MGAELVTIGTELLLGHIVDTNASWMSQRLAEAGIDVFYKSTVGDNWGRIEAAIRLAMSRADVVIMTGGLGPTGDDLTRDVLAAVLGRPLRLDAAILAHIQDRFAKRRVPMPENNRKQAMVPEGALVLHNPRGTAPGLLIREAGRVFVCMPGVPTEMRPMLAEQAIPAIRGAFGIRGRIVSRVLKTCGISESMLDMRIGDYFREMRNPSIGVLAHMGEIHVRLTCKGDDPEEIRHLLDDLERKIRERLGHLVFGRDEEKLEAVAGRLLRDRKATLAVAESCTGGLVASRLTDVPGSSEYVECGVVAYSARAKRSLLQVPEALVERAGVVSLEVALAMAEGVRRRAGTTFGLATTGIAGPTGGTPERPVGLVYVGLAWPGGSGGREFRILGEREQIKFRASQMALETLRRHLLGIPMDEA
ncbi:MAG: competence/damage-inducible protein A [Zetaproteobacteria bacterium]|nr:MAG: competence/damage-inducible protein A [Zetaproteobacteria bacterium]